MFKNNVNICPFQNSINVTDASCNMFQNNKKSFNIYVKTLSKLGLQVSSNQKLHSIPIFVKPLLLKKLKKDIREISYVNQRNKTIHTLIIFYFLRLYNSNMLFLKKEYKRRHFYSPELQIYHRRRQYSLYRQINN